VRREKECEKIIEKERKTEEKKRKEKPPNNFTTSK